MQQAVPLLPCSPTPCLGILGGTFDPPHYGHLALAETARVQLGLATVLFVPAGDPPHKPQQPLTCATLRTEMVELAIADNPFFALCRVDLERPGPHFTVDMLEIIHQQYPAAELTFLMGGDNLVHLLKWRDPQGVVRQARLGAMARPGWQDGADEEREQVVARLAQQLPTIRERLVWLDAPRLDISGSDLRRRVRLGLPLRYLVPPAVEDYVQAQRLYGSGT